MMKKLVRGALFLALVGTTIVGCEKEEEHLIKTNDTSTNLKQNESFNKSTDSSSLRLEYLSKAANVQSVTYNGNDNYTINFYDGTSSHTATVNEFSADNDYEDVYVEIQVNSPTNSTIIIDSEQESVDISGLGTYTFSEMNNVVISTSSNSLLKVASVLTAHHALIPEQSETYSDNGTTDEYPDIDDVGIRFWWTKATLVSPCFGGTEIYNVKYERLWLFKGEKTVELPC